MQKMDGNMANLCLSPQNRYIRNLAKEFTSVKTFCSWTFIVLAIWKAWWGRPFCNPVLQISHDPELMTKNYAFRNFPSRTLNKNARKKMLTGTVCFLGRSAFLWMAAWKRNPSQLPCLGIGFDLASDSDIQSTERPPLFVAALSPIRTILLDRCTSPL